MELMRMGLREENNGVDGDGAEGVNNGVDEDGAEGAEGGE